MSEEAIILDERALKIIDLNDDCLFAIVQFLNTDDLINLSRVNSRFQSAIKFVLVTKTILFNGSFLPKLAHLVRFLKDFGSHIKDFSIINLKYISFYDMKVIERFLNKYCANGNLEKCTFKSGKITKEFTENSKLFESLKSLELENVCIFDGSRNTSTQNKLVGDLILRSKMLTQLKIDTTTIDIHPFLESIIRHNNTVSTELTCLKIANANTMLRANMDPVICIKGLNVFNGVQYPDTLKPFVNIEKLSFSLNSHVNEWLELILNLKLLKELRISVRNVPQDEIDSFFRRLIINIEVLVLYTNELSDEIIKSICKMTNLKELYLGFGSTRCFNRDCVALASNLKNLCKFQFNGCLDIRNEILSETSALIDFIKIGENLQTIWLQTIKDPSNVANELYERLVEVCANGNRKTVLNVNVHCFQNLSFYLFGCESKWLKMAVYGI